MNDNPIRILKFDDISYMLKVDRFEVEDVGCVVVCRDRFRVTVVHDGFDAHIFKCECRMDTTVVELDPLADTVRTATDYENLSVLGWRIDDGRWMVFR